MSETDEFTTNALRCFALYGTTLEETLAKYVRLSSLTVSLERLTVNMDTVCRRGIARRIQSVLNRKRPTSESVYRDLTPQQRQRMEVARAEAESSKEEILAEGRVRKQAWDAMRREVAQPVATLKAERERLGLSRADVEFGISPETT